MKLVEFKIGTNSHFINPEYVTLVSPHNGNEFSDIHISGTETLVRVTGSAKSCAKKLVDAAPADRNPLE